MRQDGGVSSDKQPKPEKPQASLGDKLDADFDTSQLGDVSPHPPGNQVDRCVIAGEMVKSTSLWAVRLLVIGVFLFAIYHVLGSFWQGILPVLLALIICTVLNPIARWMRTKGLPAGLAAIITILLSSSAVGGLIASVAPDFMRQSQSLYLQTVSGIQQLQLWAQGPPLNLDSDDMSTYIDEAAGWLQQRAGVIAGSVFTGIGTATSFFFTVFIVLVLTFFFLKDGTKFLPWLRDATGRRAGWHLTELLTRAWNTLGGFIRAQALVSLIDAVCIGLGLVVIGVPLAMALAIITFVAGFIPFVGAIVAGALAVVIALVSLGLTQALLVLGLVLLVQQLEGNVLSPWLQAKAMNLHPVIVVVSVIVGTALFGLIGGFLAVPTAAMIAVSYRYVQDMMKLKSGEKSSSDLNYSTVAGYLIGLYTEEQARYKREQWRNVPEHVSPDIAGPNSASEGAPTKLDDSVDVDSTPKGSDKPSMRYNLRRARDVFENLLNGDSNK
ncbi:AI-2E family transporter [Corynebacterium macginleyi]|uniref:AI-2E family transporter n=1 Tax=Corynebacterium macginleyi TaxID=38290 RepID=UPI00190B7FC0|nr:AI-2E family transporter [Corynebacterium macginleyi]MBK4138222.1 AI-2E family transporter [Corynebacterium macginleyi]